MKTLRMLRISADPIDVDDVIATAADPRAGGRSIFIGTVRDVDADRSVSRLSYSAHPSAERVMTDIAEQVAAAYDVVSLAAIHRTGDLAIGEVAVVTVVGCEHRDAAFAACRELIDRIKAEVPIWKQQVFADGTGEWVGTP